MPNYGKLKKGDRVRRLCSECEDERNGTMLNNLEMECDDCHEAVIVVPHEDENGDAIEGDEDWSDV